MEIKDGKTVSFHYVGTLDNGEQFDSSYARNEPMTGLIGSSQLIPGFETALVGMKTGEKKSVIIEAKDAYGDRNPNAIKNVPLTSFPEDFEAVTGKIVQGKGDNGQIFTATVTEVEDSSVTLDFNHPLSGKNLNFDIEILSVTEEQQTQISLITKHTSDFLTGRKASV